VTLARSAQRDTPDASQESVSPCVPKTLRAKRENDVGGSREGNRRDKACTVCARLPIGPLMACETHARLRGNAASCRLRAVLDVVDLCFCNLFIAIASHELNIGNIKITTGYFVFNTKYTISHLFF
jgi:hypothetical protein